MSSHFVDALIAAETAGRDPPRGKEKMYACFLADVAASVVCNGYIPPHVAASAASPTLRVLSWNVHFWQRGYSGEERGDNRAAINDAVRRLSPDVILLQEVIDPTAVAVSERQVDRKAQLLRCLDPTLGYVHASWALASDCHVLPASVKAAPGARLGVAILSRLPLLAAAAVPLGDAGSNGHAATAVLALPAPSSSPLRRLGIYTAHLSVRCPGATRLAEIAGVVQHANSGLASREFEECIVGGDFNQPTQRDYPAATWRAMARDMDGVGLPLCDGVAPALRDGTDGGTPGAGDWIASFDDAGVATPQVTAWNGATVDFMYRRKRADETAAGAAAAASAAAKAGAAPPRPASMRLRCAGSWIWYGGAEGDSVPPSDHLPIIVDYTWN